MRHETAAIELDKPYREQNAGDHQQRRQQPKCLADGDQELAEAGVQEG